MAVKAVAVEDDDSSLKNWLLKKTIDFENQKALSPWPGLFFKLHVVFSFVS